MLISRCAIVRPTSPAERYMCMCVCMHVGVYGNVLVCVCAYFCEFECMYVCIYVRYGNYFRVICTLEDLMFDIVVQNITIELCMSCTPSKKAVVTAKGQVITVGGTQFFVTSNNPYVDNNCGEKRQRNTDNVIDVLERFKDIRTDGKRPIAAEISYSMPRYLLNTSICFRGITNHSRLSNANQMQIETLFGWY